VEKYGEVGRKRNRKEEYATFLRQIFCMRSN
jgi:hypothetical protein